MADVARSPILLLLAFAGCADSAADLPKHLEAAQAHLAKRHYEPAIAAFDRVLAIDPQHFEARRLKAEILYNQAKLVEAEQLLTGLCTEQPKNPDLLWAMAMVRKDQRKFAEALAMFRKLPPSKRPMLAVAECLTGIGKHDDAANRLGQLLAADPWNQQAYYLLSKVEFRRGREADGRFWGEWFKGRETWRRKESEARGMEFAGERLKGMMYRAQTLVQQGRLYEGLMELTRVVQANQNAPMAFYMIGRIMIEIGDAKSAVTAFDRVLALQPGHAEVTQLRAAEQARLRAAGGKVPAVLETAKRYAASGKPELARAAALYAARQKPEDVAGSKLVVQLFNRPGDAFVRLWALSRALRVGKDEPELRAARDAELARLKMKF